MTHERAALERAIGDMVRAAHNLSRAAETLERRALLAEEEARVLRERMDQVDSPQSTQDAL